MVMASGRWLGLRLDLLAAMLIGVVSLAAVLVSQEAGGCICKVDQIGQKIDTKFANHNCPFAIELINIFYIILLSIIS